MFTAAVITLSDRSFRGERADAAMLSRAVARRTAPTKPGSSSEYVNRIKQRPIYRTAE